MDIYLNDLSLNSSKSINENWNLVLQFHELVQKFAQFNVNIMAPKNIWDKMISGFDVRRRVCTYSEAVLTEKGKFLDELYKRLVRCDNSDLKFSMEQDMVQVSEFIGHAIKNQTHIISFKFDDLFTQDVIQGWHLRGGVPNKSSVLNIYEDKDSNYKLLADLSQCYQTNPLAEPLWNIELSKSLLEEVDFIGQDNIKVRQSLFIKYGYKIAEINGWEYDHRISSLNKSGNQLRYIFKSSHFTSYKPAYLSIDMEGPDLAFELCDHKGKHRGEISWDGKRKEPKERHDIRLK